MIINPHPAQEKFLHYQHRSLELVGWKRESRTESVQLFQVIRPQEPRIIQTFQGFLDPMMRLATKQGVPFEVLDRRTWFPEPKLELAHGFRCGQAELFNTFIKPQRSGLLQAVTRYGKSTIIANVMRVYPGVRTVLAAPGVDLLGQLVDDMRKKLPGREVLGIFTGSRNTKQSNDITITSLDSLHKVDAESTQLLLIDEPHAAVSESRAPMLAKFRNARIHGFGATLSGRFDGADKLMDGIIGPILARRTYLEAVAEGAICPIKVWMIKVSFSEFRCHNRDLAYRQLIYQNQGFNQLVKAISTDVVPGSYQTIIFADEKKQIELMNTFVQSGVQAVASKMKTTERRELFGRMVRGEIKRCIATDIFSTGVTFPDLRVIVNACGGGGGITSTQKPGRLAEVRPDKVCGHVIDFAFECDQYPGEYLKRIDARDAPWKFVVNDSRARLKVYQENGYDVNVVDAIEEIKIE